MIAQKKIYLLLVIIIAICIRFYYLTVPGKFLSEDTYKYYDVGRQMISEKYFVNDWRTPIYPLFINLPMFLSGTLNAAIYSPPFMKGMSYVLVIQSIFGIASLFLLARILLLLKVREKFILPAILFLGTNVFIFAWEKLMLPESLTLFLLVAISLVAISILNQPRYSRLLLLGILFIVAFLLRPIYLLLPAIVLVLLIYQKPKRIVLTGSFIILVVYATIVALYIQGNVKNSGYAGISRPGDINLLGKIIKFNLAIEKGKNETVIYNLLTEYKTNKGNPHPWRFLEAYFDTFYKSPAALNTLPEFNRLVIADNLPTFIYLSIQELPPALLDPSENYIFPIQKKNILSLAFNLLYELNRRLSYLTLIVFVAYPISLLQFLRTKNHPERGMFVIATVAIYQILTSVFLSYGEFGRLISPALSLIYLFSFYFWGKIFKSLYRRFSLLWRR